MRSAMEEDAKDGKSQFSAEEVRRLKSEFLKLMMERFLQVGHRFPLWCKYRMIKVAHEK